ncbi:hypothetical protein [uncultured Rubinisphaera sp.]|uniref:hypothetical protein n=1 Tax=uncultured Rubinisphaera sp. TaxID=1678686 RepID=UPI0026C85165|tara:strand:+ start:1382 stop:1741 length:360 start_codon:yes stop_codon:yes gene_type:complete
MFKKILTDLWQDENGFIISAELVLIATILIIGLIVGLTAIQTAVVAELNDIGDGIGTSNQSYYYSGFSSYKNDGNGGNNALKAYTRGSAFDDDQDDCDNDQCDIACDMPVNEGPKDINN